MILEGIVTTINAEGLPNIAPMGPLVDSDMMTLRLRPYQTSRTYQNLKQHPQGVFHVIDNVLLLARAAIGQLEEQPPLMPAKHVRGVILQQACRWYEFEVVSLDDSQERTDIVARVVFAGRMHDFFGFNRAKHAVLEAAILATRVHLLPPEHIEQEFERLQVMVQKTAGPQEHEAFDLLLRYVTQQLPPQPKRPQ